MRKVDREYDNPIDNLIIDVGDKILPYLKSIGHTPNVLTTYSFILGLVSVYFLYKDNLYPNNIYCISCNHLLNSDNLETFKSSGSLLLGLPIYYKNISENSSSV